MAVLAVALRARVTLALAGLALLLVSAPAGAAAGGAAGVRQQIDLVVGLRWRDQAALEKLLRDLSDPDSPGYGRYLTASEFDARFAPTDATIEATRMVLRDHGLGVIDVSPSGLFLTASGWVLDVTETRNQLLTALRDLTQEVRLYFYLKIPGAAGSGEGGSAAGDGAAEMRPPLSATTLAPRLSEAAFTPETLARAYGFDRLYARGFKGERSRRATIAIATAYGFDRDDLRAFWADHGLTRSDGDIPLIWVGGAGAGHHIETTVDVQWTSALAPESPILVYASPEPSGHGFLKVYDRITSENRAAVMVTSWGACERELSLTYLEQAHIVFQRAAAQGITVIAASGDRGADDCLNGDVSVDFPASDPNVLAVGGTKLRNDGVYGTETAWSGSGGGASTVWAAPHWQMHPSPMRVLADVSLHADPSPGFATRFENRSLVVGGTSLAAPAWAALLALANEARTSGGGETLGVAAPALCEAALSRDLPEPPFRDILRGNNGAFSTGVGWDFPTGWGSPHAASLVDSLARSIPRPLTSAQAVRGILLTPSRDDAGGMRAQLFHQCARTALWLQGRGLVPGDYEVSLNQTPVASFTVDASGRSSVTLRGLDPRGAAISVARVDGAAAFGGQFPAHVERSARVGVDLDGTETMPDASGYALYQRRHGRERFIVRVRDVPPGVYDLRLGNAVVAPLTVPPGRSGARLSFNLLGARGAYQALNPLCDSISIAHQGVTVLRAGRYARGLGLCP